MTFKSPFLRVVGIVTALMLAAVGLSTSDASIDAVPEGQAAAMCTAAYPGVTGPDPLSPCQWNMEAINAFDAHATATGDGVSRRD